MCSSYFNDVFEFVSLLAEDIGEVDKSWKKLCVDGEHGSDVHCGGH